MKTRLFLDLLGLTCLLNCVTAACDLKGKKQDAEFPNLLKYTAESYVMGVEYSIPNAKQTDYYTEYYEAITTRGRINSHSSGETQIFIYRADTQESWTLGNGKCELRNTSTTPEFFKSAQTDWIHTEGEQYPTTIGPSAMFKNAYDEWKKPKKDRKMAYMGLSPLPVRGETAVFWRRCLNDNNYIDYFFAADTEENAYDTDAFGKVITPLRVDIIGAVASAESPLSVQYYDIIYFKHLIPVGEEPFQLPKGRNCMRDPNAGYTKVPDFSKNDIFIATEVVYNTYEKASNELLSTYYSTLMFALDRESNHIAYYYSTWNTTSKDPETDDPFVNVPEYVIYDINHAYSYKINYGTGKCELGRSKKFNPQYKFPDSGEGLDLTSPYVLFPNNELAYLSEGRERKLKVDIFETEIKGFLLNKDTQVDRAIVSKSFLKENEKLETTVEVQRALAQIELRLFNDNEDNYRVITFNVFGFSTRLPQKQRIFDVRKCFRNDDDYSVLSVGFEVEPKYVPEMESKLPEVEEAVMEKITGSSELNIVRIPVTMSNINKNYVFVTMIVLQKPDLKLDFVDVEENKRIVSADSEGLENFNDCATKCLETKNDCRGFSLCKAVCYFGYEKDTETKEDNECNTYRRYEKTYMPSKESQIRNIVRQINNGEFKIVVISDKGDMINLVASVAQVEDPAEDDSFFENMGNKLNPRMAVHKVGAKLSNEGTVFKRLGKLRYDECQTECLDMEDCETISYCLINSKCVLSSTYASDLEEKKIEKDDLCILLKRKYADHFDRSPGVFLISGGGIGKDVKNVEDCARECLKEKSIKCLSFDHCAAEDKKGCTLYSTHYLSRKSKEDATLKNPSCGHYSRKVSVDFKKENNVRRLGSKIAPLQNLTLEECAKACVEYGEGACYGYDFCQDETLYATLCTLYDSDPSQLESAFSPICNNYLRTQVEYTPRPITNNFESADIETEMELIYRAVGYAGGIGFVCFLVGGLIGVALLFGIAYYKVNRS